MLSFEIGQREGGFYSERTDTHTETHADTPSTALVYRYGSDLSEYTLFQVQNVFFYLKK